MKPLLTALLASILTMLPIDALWLTLMGKRFYGRQIGPLMADKPHLLPAALFYLLYGLTLSVLVVLPAARAGFSVSKTFAYGAILGLGAYAAYDLTNQATLKNWPVAVTLVDLAWGTLLTGVVAVVATWVTAHFDSAQ